MSALRTTGPRYFSKKKKRKISVLVVSSSVAAASDEAATRFAKLCPIPFPSFFFSPFPAIFSHYSFSSHNLTLCHQLQREGE